MIKLEENKKYRLSDKFGKIVDFLCLKIEGNSWDENKKEYCGICCTVNLSEIFFDFSEVFYKIKFTKEELTNYKIEPLIEEPNFVKYQDLSNLFKNIQEIFFIGKTTLRYNKNYIFSDFRENDEEYFCTIFYFRLDNLFTEIIFCDLNLDQQVNLPYVYIFQSEFKEDLSMDLFDYQKYHILFSFDTVKRVLLNKYFNET